MSRHVVGIDLGTTHTALARAPLDGDDKARPEVVNIPQLVGPSSLEARPLLPSFLYLAHPSEGPLALPWDAERRFAVGELARSRGADAPARLIASAKSWLCHPSIDRRAGTLPVGAPADIEKLSAVEASWRYLEHLIEAYAATYPGSSLVDEEVILTVPASFDAAARELTVEAATAAGLEHLTLLEEPQAALYAFIDAVGDKFRKLLTPGDILLVVDVGGGTTDFSAIAVGESAGSLELLRIAVGDHILLGGDNMDLALGHTLKKKLEAQGKTVDRDQLAALVYASREAKERLLSNANLDHVPVAVAGRGSSLFGSALRTELTREEVETLLVNGFFPACAASDRPHMRARGALTQLGLPYAQDAAVTRHLAAFLGKQAGAAGGQGALLRPTAVLFNGGVMKAAPIRARVLETLSSWLRADGAPAPRVLEEDDLDHAVARGAAYYGLARRGRGLRIRGGTARAYYIGIESAMPAIPGMDPPTVALCVAPFGMEEGSVAALPPEELGAVVGEPVRFRFFASTVRRNDSAGTVVEEPREDEMEELPPIEVTLPIHTAEGQSTGRREGEVVPVTLASRVTEVGTLLLEAVPEHPRFAEERWKVELSVRTE